MTLSVNDSLTHIHENHGKLIPSCFYNLCSRSLAASHAGVRMLMSRLPALSESGVIEEEQPLLPPRTSSRIMPAQLPPRAPILPPRTQDYRTPPR